MLSEMSVSKTVALHGSFGKTMIVAIHHKSACLSNLVSLRLDVLSIRLFSSVKRSFVEVRIAFVELSIFLFCLSFIPFQTAECRRLSDR